LAELDLKLRGAGDFFGTRQHGLPTFAIANLYRDMEILKTAQEAAQANFLMSNEESNILKNRVAHVLSTTRGGTL
jgi:ATP-dependent DNA helicase RecG